ncbi:MAG: MMPL family transporter [Gammaproteobacteria bacterium]|nr:MMPL family transporter [Gammaproteobacteria bacterium]
MAMLSKRWLSLGGWLLLVLLVVFALQRGLQLDSDMQFFLPPAASPQQQLVLDELQQGAAARLWLLAIRAESEATAAALSQRLAESLAGESAFVQVLNRPQPLPEEEQQAWFVYRYLLSELPEMDAASLHQSLQWRLEELASPLGPLLRQTLASDPTAQFQQWLQAWQGEAGPVRRHGVWFGDDGRALLLLRSRAAGMELDAQAANLTLIESHFAALPGSAGASLSIGGAAPLAVTSRDTIRSEAQWLSLLATLLVALILLWAWRSPRLWLLAALPLGSAVLGGLWVTQTLFGQVHGITLAFGITLLGVALDYPLHLFSQLRPGSRPSEALAVVWPRLRLGVLSTAAGYLAMIASGFPGLVQLGAFAASGLLVAALVTWLVLPAALPRIWQGRESQRAALPVPPAWRMRVRIALLLGLAGLSLLVLLTSPRPIWQSELAALSPIPEPLRQQETALRQALGLAELGQMLAIRGDSAEVVLQRSEDLLPQLQAWQQAGLIQDVELATALLPSERRQRQRQQALPDPLALQAALDEAQQGLPFRQGVFADFVEALRHSHELAPLQPAMLETLLPDSLLAARLAPLLFERDGQWWALLRLHGLQDGQALADWVATNSDGDLHYLDLARDTSAMMLTFQRAALSWLGGGALLIGLLLWWGLAGLRQALPVLLPVLSALLVTLALLHLMGQLLSVFHLVALLLVLGIGLDYSLFFQHGGNRQQRRRTGHALRLCAISSMAVFVILALSSLPVLQAIGLTVSVGILTSFLFAWLLTPAGVDPPNKA